MKSRKELAAFQILYENFYNAKLSNLMKMILDLLMQGGVLLVIFFLLKVMLFNRPSVKLDSSNQTEIGGDEHRFSFDLDITKN